MKKIIFIILFISVTIGACNIEQAHVDVTVKNPEHSKLYGQDWRLENDEMVWYDIEYNVYEMDVSLINTGDMTAYDVEVDLHLISTKGKHRKKTYVIGDMEPDATHTFNHSEIFKEGTLDDYYAEAFWSY